MTTSQKIKPMARRQKPHILFCYLFFALFVFNMLSILVSLLSNTFSQLFFIFAQQGGIFDRFVHFFYLFGAIIALYALIISSQNQRKDFAFKFLMIGFCVGFIFIFVLTSWQEPQHLQLLDLITQKAPNTPTHNLSYLLILLFFALSFVILPFMSMHFKLIPDMADKIGFFLFHTRPSLNTSLYVLMGIATQGYFSPKQTFFYWDISILILCLSLLFWILFKHKEEFKIYERINLFLLCCGIFICSFASDLLSTSGAVVRYSFFACGFVSWCLDWMLEKTSIRSI